MRWAPLLSLGLVACWAAPVADRMPRLAPNQLLEQVAGTERVVPRGVVATADPRSDLLLRFGTDDVDSGPLTSGLLETLARAEAMMIERDTMLTKATRPTDAEGIRAVQAASSDFAARALSLLRDMKQLGFSDDEILAASDADADQESSVFPTLIRLMRQRFEREQDAFAAHRRLANEHTVTVQARIEPRGKQAKYLHIDGYDNLPVGEMEPQYGGFLGVSRDELEALDRDLRTVEKAADLLRSIDRLGTDARQRIDALRDELRAALAKLIERTLTKPDAVAATLRADLQQRSTQGNDEAKAAASTALQSLDALLALPAQWQTVRGKAQALHTQLSSTSTQRLSDLLAATGPLRTGARELVAAIGPLTTQLTKVPEQVTTVTKFLASTERELPPELAAFVARLQQELAPVRDLFAFVATLQTSADAAKGAIAAGATRVDSALFLPLNNAPDARIRLGNTDIREGDRVHVEVIYQPKGTTEREDRITEAWDVDVDRYGFYPRVGAQLIFARADTGTADAKSWKPNAAAVADMHYRFQNPSGCGEVWNVLDPGLGLHLASLDQGDQNVEFGLGVNASLFGGFVTAGYGWNLAARDNGDYWFVGIDLIDVLNKAQKFVAGD